MLGFINTHTTRKPRKSLRMNLDMIIAGDSIADGTATAYAPDYMAALSTHGIDATIHDSAQGGLAIGTYRDILTNTKIDAGYDAKMINLAGVENVAKARVMVFGCGTNDINALASGNYTEQQYEDAYLGHVDEINNDPRFANLEYILIRPIGRHTTQSSLGFQVAMEAIRRIQYKVASLRPNVIMLPPYWGRVLADSVHPNGASYIAMAWAEAAHIAYILGKAIVPNDGMSISSAVVDELGILLNIDHDNGTDFTVPVFGEGVEAVQIMEGSKVYDFDGFERVNANQLRFYTGAPFGGDNIQIDTIYGSLFDLGQGEPPMVRDNSDHALPFIDQVVDVTNPLRANDPILRLTNRAYYTHPAYGKTITAGDQFSSIASVDGGNLTTRNGDFVTDPTAFDGVGGIHSVNDVANLGGGGNRIDPTNGYMVGFVIGIDSTPADKEIFALGDSSYGPYNTAKFYTTANNRIYCYRTDTTNSLFVTSGVFGQRLAFILNLKSSTEAEIYINNATTPVVTFDPHADMALAKSMFLNGFNNGNSLNRFGCVWGKSGGHDGVNDPPIVEIMNKMKGDYNIL